MNQARKRTGTKKVLSMILVLVMLLSLLSMAAFTLPTAASSDSAASNADFMRIFHLDCGRKYFSVAEIESLIDTASENNYTHVELAIGNDGLRFLLDDMSLTVNGEQYVSEDVSREIHNGNEKYYNFDVDELTQSDMDAIIAYAQSKNISIIPLINTPGHMDAILDCMTALGVTNAAYMESARTIDVTNTSAVAFTEALLQKYINYFAGKGCGYFNMGADEYANDKTNGFSALLSAGKYGNFVTYVNAVAKMITDVGMTPIAFNDGIYYNKTTSYGKFSDSIVVSYWENSGTAPASFIAEQGHKILNTNKSWYYVPGNTGTWASLNTATNGVKNTPVTSVVGDSSVTPIGAMLCVWCDNPGVAYDSTVKSNVDGLMKALSEKNSTYFTTVVPQVESFHNNRTLFVNGSTVLRLSTGLNAEWSVSDASVLSLGGMTRSAESTVTANRVTVKALARGNATVTATVNGQTYSMDLTVTGENDMQVNLTVGETWSKTMLGQALSSYTHDDEVAKVNVTSKRDLKGETTTSMTAGTAYYIVNSEGKYLDANAKWVDNAENAAQWTWISHNKGFYLDLSSKGNEKWLYYSNGQWTTQRGWWNSNCSYFTGLTDGKLVSNDGDVLGTPITVGSEPIDISTITITGKAVGDTDATIGNAQYHITVMPSDALKADSITLEYMITTCRVHDYTSSNDRYTITSAAASDAAGVDVSTLAPVNGYFYLENDTDKPKTDATYWQTMRLDKDHKQADSGWGDSTGFGTPLTRVRSHSGAWQYQTADGTWQYFRTGDQLVSYYVQKTDVTKDVITYTKDWGEVVTSTHSSSGGNHNNGQVALTFAVVYPDGTVSPKESEMYPGATTIFNFESGGRDIGVIMPKNNENYNISKITVTDGKRDSANSDKWSNNDTITWEKKTTAAGGKWYKETEVWNKASGTDPVVNGKTCENGMWTAKNTAKLVLIYLEPVVKETNLNIVYWDDTANKQINPNTIQISMAYNQGGTKPTYFTALCDANGNAIGDKGPWNSNVVGSANYLPNDAYVVNSSNVHQTISKDMTQIEGIAGNYTSGLYEYRSADISTDGKTLTLHYGLKNTGMKTYVVDFGLPVTIPLSDLGITDLNTISWISLKQEDKECLTDHGTYGAATIDKNNWTVTYTLDQTLDNEIAIPINIKFTNSNEIKSFSFHVIPAASVYYEDSFATFTNADKSNGVNKKTDNGYWMTDGTTVTDAKQALEALGSQQNVYGYDGAYTNCSTFSMGSATKVTVNADTSKLGQSPTATFTFKGTGFDVISLTGNHSGTVMYTVTNTETGASSTNIVNTYYGYKYENGEWVKTDAADPSALYQIPVIKENLTYGTYEVTISVLYGDYFNSTANNWYTFWLDAIRVYNPMGKDNETYRQDNEGYPQYIMLRDQLAKENGSVTTNGNLLFIDGAQQATIATYKDYGPNNEVYLANGQAITFTVPENANIASIQIGAKAPDGSAAQMVVNGEAKDIQSATEMYYEIGTEGKNFTIANNGDGILSLTNLKITFTTSGQTVTLSAPTAEEQTAAVMSVRALFAAPEQTFEPEHFTAKWSRNVRKGGTATLTVKASADVESITVNGEKITAYTTKTARSFWGAKETYHVFTYRVTNAATATYSICAVNADGVASDPITATLTVRPSIRDWWNGIFDKWKH